MWAPYVFSVHPSTVEGWPMTSIDAANASRDLGRRWNHDHLQRDFYGAALKCATEVSRQMDLIRVWGKTKCMELVMK